MKMFVIQRNGLWQPHGEDIPNGAALGNYRGIDYYILSLENDRQGFMHIYVYDKDFGEYIEEKHRDNLSRMILWQAREHGITELKPDIKTDDELVAEEEARTFTRWVKKVMQNNPNSAKFERKTCKCMKNVSKAYAKRGDGYLIVYAK